jgi:glycosyltransferase involved in cell wall biosynthesis
MKVGLVITVFNRPKYLSQTLDSLKRSCLKDTTIYLIDDCSTNKETHRLFDEFSINDVPILKIKNTRNEGMFNGLKKGFKYFFDNGFDVITNLDSDTLVKPYWLQVLLDLYQENKNNLISGFNTPAFASTEQYETYHVKSKIGGINLLFDRSLCQLVISCLNRIGWDMVLSDVIRDNGHKIMVTYPSVIHHLGTQSTVGNKYNDHGNIWIGKK